MVYIHTTPVHITLTNSIAMVTSLYKTVTFDLFSVVVHDYVL